MSNNDESQNIIRDNQQMEKQQPPNSNAPLSNIGTVKKELCPINFRIVLKINFFNQKQETIEEFIKENPDYKKILEKESGKEFSKLDETEIKEIIQYIIERKYFNKNETKIIDIKEISNKFIGILFNNNSLSIYNPSNFSKVGEIKVDVPQIKQNANYFDYNNKKEIIYNFIELENSDLVLWTLKRIYFYKFDKEYIQYQIIDESNEKAKNDDDDFDYYMEFGSRNQKEYNIYSVYQLKNGNIVTGNTNCIKIYTKKNDNYILLSKIDADFEVKNIIEIEPNKLLLMQKNFKSGGFCSQTYYCIHTYSLTLYDIEKNEFHKLNEFKENLSLHFNGFNHFKNDKYLYVKYGEFKFDIFDINQNMKSINSNNEIIEVQHIKEYYNFFRERQYDIVKDDQNIIFLCNYSKDLFFAQNLNDGEINIYKFKDKSFEFYQKFPLSNKEIIGMLKLKNNNLIMYSFKTVYLFQSC